jgi:hypothetical protein
MPKSNENISDNEFINVEWDENSESILCRWCDHAKCYYWLSYNAHQYYYKIQSLISLPIMTFSTILGAASFANISTFSTTMQLYLPLIVGGVNIYIGILTTYQQYFKISENNESFRLCAKSWDKFNREIELELSKQPKQRKVCGLFLKKIYEDYERLIDTTPNFPTFIIDKFKEMKKNLYKKDPRFVNISEPGILYPIYSSREMVNTSQRREEQLQLKWFIQKENNDEDDEDDSDAEPNKQQNLV